MNPPTQAPPLSGNLLRKLILPAQIAGVALFCVAIYTSTRLGIATAKQRLPEPIPRSEGSSILFDDSAGPLYLARSPESLRQFFTAHPTPRERADADLSGAGIRRLRGVSTLRELRSEGDVIQIEVESGPISGLTYWIHHSQIPAPSESNPIISPIPTASGK